jgi:hypothetical protein
MIVIVIFIFNQRFVLIKSEYEKKIANEIEIINGFPSESKVQ